MTVRSRECKVQVQASRVSARIAALSVRALALALLLAAAPTVTTDEGGDSRPRATMSEEERAIVRKAGAEDARRSRLRNGLPERIEDLATIAVLVALLRAARRTSETENVSHKGRPAA
jgi:hypothetical protein